jgi:hypothetical protein
VRLLSVFIHHCGLGTLIKNWFSSAIGSNAVKLCSSKVQHFGGFIGLQDGEFLHRKTVYWKNDRRSAITKQQSGLTINWTTSVYVLPGSSLEAPRGTVGSSSAMDVRGSCYVLLQGTKPHLRVLPVHRKHKLRTHIERPHQRLAGKALH